MCYPALADDNVEVFSTSKSKEIFSLIENTKPDLLIIDLQMAVR
jgi:DNA-binding NarL/FixJ family response regulator